MSSWHSETPLTHWTIDSLTVYLTLATSCENCEIVAVVFILFTIICHRREVCVFVELPEKASILVSYLVHS